MIADVVGGYLTTRSACRDRVVALSPNRFSHACLDELKTRPEYQALPEE